LARLLRDVLAPHAFIIHEDDFYKTDAEIPVVRVADGRDLQDWDCLESVDLEGLKAMLEYVKQTGKVMEGFESKEDKNEVGVVDVDPDIVEVWKGRFAKLLGEAKGGARIAIIDGFLLFSEDMIAIRELFDVRMLLRTDHATVKRRREARKGYVTLEGFWEDPENYVDLIVWPNYVKDHSFLFEGGDVEGELESETCGKLEIMGIPKEAVQNMSVCFEWACGILLQSLDSIGAS